MQHRHTNHLGHFILTILFFPWALAWILFYLSNQRHNDEVDRLIWQSTRK